MTPLSPLVAWAPVEAGAFVVDMLVSLLNSDVGCFARCELNASYGSFPACLKSQILPRQEGLEQPIGRTLQRLQRETIQAPHDHSAIRFRVRKRVSTTDSIHGLMLVSIPSGMG